jgi:hypothetical protein
MAEPEFERQQGTSSTARPTASSMIADLWSEREQSRPAPPAPPVKSRPGRPPGESKTGLVVAVVALALLLGGGAGVFLATQGVGMPSIAKYAAKADDVCRPANGAVLSITQPTSYPDVATAAGTMTAVTDTQLQGLRRLKPPGGTDGGRVGNLLQAMTQTNAASRSLQDAAGQKDDAATAAATRQMRASATEASTTAKDLGFAACATGMQPGVDAMVGGATAVVKTAFIAKADTLCRAAVRSVTAIPEPRAGITAFGRYMTQILQVVQKMAVDLKAIPVPPGDETTVAEMLASMDKANAKWGEAPGAAAAGDASRLSAIVKEAAPLDTASSAKFDAYGLESCGSNAL